MKAINRRTKDCSFEECESCENPRRKWDSSTAKPEIYISIFVVKFYKNGKKEAPKFAANRLITESFEGLNMFAWYSGKRFQSKAPISLDWAVHLATTSTKTCF